MSKFSAELRGLRETQANMDRIARELHGDTMVEGMRDATLYVVRDARKLAPVDRGILRASILPEVRSEGRTVQGVIGSNQQHAPFMEFGTRPHWPPLGALAVWARRHGTSAFVVARAIARHGIKARRYLRGALEMNVGRIVSRLERAVQESIRK